MTQASYLIVDQSTDIYLKKSAVIQQPTDGS